MDAVKTFYANYSEDGRLERDNFHRIEFLTSMRYLERVLLPDSRILDACAGTGIYSFALAQQGHNVTACDLVPGHVEKMNSRNTGSRLLHETRVCNVLDMSCFQDGSFDAVLCMGAMYHLFTPEDRKRAVIECLRVLKPGGLFAAAYISRYAQLVLALSHEGIDKFDAALECVERGITDKVSSGLAFYRSTPTEMLELMTGCCIEKLHIIGTDGIGHVIAGLINSMSKEDFNRWLEYHFTTCEDNTLLGYSLHGLYIGRKNL